MPQFSKGEDKLLLGLCVALLRGSGRASETVLEADLEGLFRRPSEFREVVDGLVKGGLLTRDGVRGELGLCLERVASVLGLDARARGSAPLPFEERELDRAVREECANSARDVGASCADGAAGAREPLKAVSNRCPDGPEPGVEPACKWCGGKTNVYGPDVSPGYVASLQALRICDGCARKRGAIRTYVSTSRTFSEKERTIVLEEKNVLGELLREEKWARRLREEPHVMQRAVASAKAQWETGFRPKKSVNGWMFLNHYKPAGGRLD